jgi:hypothetical protein
MGAEIFVFPGATPEQPSTPQAPTVTASVVELLEDLLAEAKRGEIRAIAVALVHDDGAPADTWAGEGGMGGHMLTAAATYLVARLANTAIGRGEVVTKTE